MSFLKLYRWRKQVQCEAKLKAYKNVAMMLRRISMFPEAELNMNSNQEAQKMLRTVARLVEEHAGLR